MTTVREAAIANGWNPADGSPWVGPDGVTYASKNAWYASQGVAHRENCLCEKAVRDLPALMWDERSVADMPGLSNVILERLARELEDLGAPMVRTYKRRWNAAGEGIGPELKIRACDARLFWRVQERVLRAIERAAERQR